MTGKPSPAEEIQARLVRFAARTTRVAKALPKTAEGRYLSQQILRSVLAAQVRRSKDRGKQSRFHSQVANRTQGIDGNSFVVGPDRGKWSIFQRQTRLRQNGPSRLYLISRILD